MLDTAAGIAAACGRHWDAAASLDEKALRLADELPFVSEQAEIRYWYARMLVDRDAAGDGERAGSMLERALAIYGRIGMPWHAERARALLSPAG